MFTKTQLKIMQLFTSQITKRFSLRGVAKELDMHPYLVHKACKPLIQDKIIIQDDNRYILNYKDNHQELAYVEHLRNKEFLRKPKNKTLAMFAEEMIEEFPYGYFILAIFGSAVTIKNPRDIDVLVIIEKTEDIETAEKALYNITRNYTFDLHTAIVSFESVYEMLRSRDDKNVMNEVLNKHIILYGAELFYRLIKRGRT
ncbi:MAG: hypothetical protein ABIH34_04460 [Nanoarchaeota archaeon]